MDFVLEKWVSRHKAGVLDDSGFLDSTEEAKHSLLRRPNERVDGLNYVHIMGMWVQ